MAKSDYRLCDVCGEKAFYDSNLNYDTHTDVNGEPSPDYVGEWVVLCDSCAKTHTCRIVERAREATPDLLSSMTEPRGEIAKEAHETSLMADEEGHFEDEP